tara:strand:- start:1131 stop:1571 length:441 start_codon:yes stop_codon:yes gene_type:complete
MSIYDQGREFWGPKLWYVLHAIAELYDPKDCAEYTAFYYRSLVLIIPCSECRAHTKDYIKSRPPNFKSRRSLRIWTYNFHNYVNNQLNKGTLVLDGNDIHRVDALEKNYIDLMVFLQHPVNYVNTNALNIFVRFIQMRISNTQNAY